MSVPPSTVFRKTYRIKISVNDRNPDPIARRNVSMNASISEAMRELMNRTIAMCENSND